MFVHFLHTNTHFYGSKLSEIAMSFFAIPIPNFCVANFFKVENALSCNKSNILCSFPISSQPLFGSLISQQVFFSNQPIPGSNRTLIYFRGFSMDCREDLSSQGPLTQLRLSAGHGRHRVADGRLDSLF